MKNLLVVFLLFGLFSTYQFAHGQAPQAFNYQAVVRDANGDVMANQNVLFKMSILSGSQNGSAVYSETHDVLTNALGLVNLQVGNGTPVTGTFSSIDWGSADHYIKTEVDVNGGGTYENLGATQLLSVPYALQAGNTSEVWEPNGSAIFYNEGNVGIGTDSPSQKLDVRGNLAFSDVLLHGNDTLFFTTEENFFIAPGRSFENLYKANWNMFIGLGSGSSLKGGLHNTLIGYSAGSRLRFHVNNNTFIGSRAGQNAGGSSNTYVGAHAGRETGGTDNTFVGESAGAGRSKFQNTFIGSQAGKVNQGARNTFIGALAGESNEGAEFNVFVGATSGKQNTTGRFNTFVGYASGRENTKAEKNTFIGYLAGEKNINGEDNTFLGNAAGANNTDGIDNTFVGSFAGRNNESGHSNVFIGDYSGNMHVTGERNTFIGSYAGFNNDKGKRNIFIGFEAGYNETRNDKLIIANGRHDDNVLLFGDFDTKRIGIGTLSPSSKFTVVGVIESTEGGIKFPDGTIQTTAATATQQLSALQNEVELLKQENETLKSALDEMELLKAQLNQLKAQMEQWRQLSQNGSEATLND
ncbi:MAG: cell division protein ZapB [Bacteroidota bacterium]